MTASDYIKNQAEDRQKILTEVQKTIKKLYPGIEENMGYKMPTYVLEGETLCALASQKNYMALYVMPHDLMNKEFGEELKAYNCGKSCIRFKQLKEDTLPLFERILDYCGKHYPDSAFYGRMNAKK